MKNHILFFLIFTLFFMKIHEMKAQFNTYSFNEIESGAKHLSKYYDSISYHRQHYFVAVYYIQFDVVPDCKKSYRIVKCETLSELLETRYNYYFTIYGRYFLFYSQDSINYYRVTPVDPAFRDELKHVVRYDAGMGCGDPGMACVFNDCAKEKLYFAYAPGSRYKNAVKEEKKSRKRFFKFLRKRRPLF